MPIRAKCPGCAAVVGAPDAAAGKKVKCPKCGGLIPVPEPDPEVVSDFDVVDDDTPPPPRAAMPVAARAVASKPKPAGDPGFEVIDDGDDGDDKPTPPKPKKKPAAVVEDDDDDRPAKPKPKKKAVVADDDDDDDDDRPRKKKGNKDAGGPPWLLIRLAILLFVGAVVIAGVYFYKKGESGTDTNTAPAGGGDPAARTVGSKYVELNDPVGGFSILLPGVAQKGDSAIPGLQGSSWKVDTTDPGPTSVRVGSFVLPPGLIPPGGANAAAALAQLDPRVIDANSFKKEKQEEKILGGKTGTVITLSPTKPAGTPGRTYLTVALVFGDGGKVFGIEIASPEPPDPQLVSTVLTSFRIL